MLKALLTTRPLSLLLLHKQLKICLRRDKGALRGLPTGGTGSSGGIEYSQRVRDGIRHERDGYVASVLAVTRDMYRL